MSDMLVVDMNKLTKNLKIKQNSSKKIPVIFKTSAERSSRSNLIYISGDTTEKYDQFYRDHKLLLKLFVFLGVMPLAREAGKVTFKWKSPQMFYALFFYIFTSTLVLRVGYERFKILVTITEFDEYIYAVIFIIFLIPHFWIPYVGWSVAHRVAQYKSMWASFQVRFYYVTGTTLTFPSLNALIIILFIGCVLLSIVFLYSLSRLMDGFLLWHTIAYFHIITMINMNAALLYINSKATITASNSLSSCFVRDMGIDGKASKISEYRILWLDLSDILQTLGNTYARTYSTYCLFMSINITIGSYGALSEIFESGFSYKVLGLIVLTIYCASLLFIVCNCSHNATSVIAKGVQDTLLSANLLQMDIQAQKEIDLFISAIELNPPVVSMQGYGLINRGLLTSTISTITIYLIVLLQFKLSIVTEKKLKSNFFA